MVSGLECLRILISLMIPGRHRRWSILTTGGYWLFGRGLSYRSCAQGRYTSIAYILQPESYVGILNHAVKFCSSDI
jgi:hypothetical protein